MAIACCPTRTLAVCLPTGSDDSDAKAAAADGHGPAPGFRPTCSLSYVSVIPRAGRVV